MMFNNFHGMWNYWFFGALLLIMVAIFVASDAAQFGQSGLLWALVVLLMPMMGIVIYIVVRSTWTRQESAQQMPQRRTVAHVEQVQAPRRVGYENTQYDTYNEKVNEDFRDTFFCTSCGAENNSSVTFCNSCGAKILR